VVWVSGFAQQGIQSTCYLDGHAACAPWIAKDGDRFDEISDGFGSISVSGSRTVCQRLLKPSELLFILIEDGRVQRDFFLRWRFMLQFLRYPPPFGV
jgi:hypothetical protein